MKVLTGLDRILKDAPNWLLGRRVGLLCHQASVTAELIPAHMALKELLGKGLVRLFSPQHGLYGTDQANMISSEDFTDPLTGVPVVSLYGPRLKPEKAHLEDLDLILVDLWDVGCRVYTYLWTLYLLLEVAEEAGVEIAILDRPNPLGGFLEGPLLSPEYFSFVGLSELPLRHGLTLGEAALLFKTRRRLSLPLRVVKVQGWRRDRLFPETGLTWVMPSPNMPTFETALVYPGQVLLEGTNLSEGRGSTRPFQLFGAPWLDQRIVLKRIERFDLPGAVLRPTAFKPVFDKWQGRICYGFEIHVQAPYRFQAVKTTLLLLRIIRETHPEFTFRLPPYEFEEKHLPIEIILGKRELVDFINGKMDLEGLDFYLNGGLIKYRNEAASLAIYEGGFFYRDGWSK
ncbi:exo-beta-N-acetylmuramidase NamZ family protein [Thermosulfurimonas dismutans]|uniref:DUF1343 domain-containing protein n=1 Tax=Thermosulfurimonas dismutans TaxID=999894 RepID=A0A179D4Z5_9BACT|nr:DUF1343 domain-containing protein [Thermosulfurimonas dismutans]OAQ21043.1 hypothetical protein TDIS_0969 [Thermosulfurimonas dismutans]